MQDKIDSKFVIIESCNYDKILIEFYNRAITLPILGQGLFDSLLIVRLKLISVKKKYEFLTVFIYDQKAKFLDSGHNCDALHDCSR